MRWSARAETCQHVRVDVGYSGGLVREIGLLGWVILPYGARPLTSTRVGINRVDESTECSQVPFPFLFGDVFPRLAAACLLLDTLEETLPVPRSPFPAACPCTLLRPIAPMTSGRRASVFPLNGDIACQPRVERERGRAPGSAPKPAQPRPSSESGHGCSDDWWRRQR